MKEIYSIFLLGVIFVAGCAQTEIHATQDNVDDCFLEHADDSYEEKLGDCQEEICQNDEHCFEEVEEMSEKFK